MFKTLLLQLCFCSCAYSESLPVITDYFLIILLIKNGYNYYQQFIDINYNKIMNYIKSNRIVRL